MPHTPSAKKHLRKSTKQRLHNRAVKRTLKETLKDVMDIAQTNKPDELKKAINLANKKLDKAAAKRVIHPNQAARKKGQLARLLNKKPAASKPAAAKPAAATKK